MKPYGLRQKFNYNGYQDRRGHPHSKYVNWWEVELNAVKSKKTARFAGKKQVEKELINTLDNYIDEAQGFNYYTGNKKLAPDYCCDDHYFHEEIKEAYKSGLLK